MPLPKATDRTIQDIAAEHAPRAIEVLVEIMDDEVYEPKDRISAAEKLLNRGHGMPTQAVIVAPSTSKARKLAATMTDEQLQAIIEQKQLPSMLPRQPMVTVEATQAPAQVLTPFLYESQRDPLSGEPAGAEDFADINDEALDPMLL